MSYQNNLAKQLDGANRPDAYGLDAELAAKQTHKRDPKTELEVKEWIEKTLGKQISGDLQEQLRDGVILCEVINKLKPGSVQKINHQKMPFFLMENINNFLSGCRAFHVPDTDLFMTVDLYENQNFNQVVQCVHSLARIAQEQPGYHGPTVSKH